MIPQSQVVLHHFYQTYWPLLLQAHRNHTGTIQPPKPRESFREEPGGRDRRASEIEYLFSVSFPLVGNPSDCLGSQERFWTSQNDRNKELRQRPQGVQFIKIKSDRLSNLCYSHFSGRVSQVYVFTFSSSESDSNSFSVIIRPTPSISVCGKKYFPSPSP